MAEPDNVQAGLNVFEAQSGYPSAKVIREDGNSIHLHSLVHPEDEWRYFENLELWGDVVIFLGTGLGYHATGFAKKLSSVETIILVDFYPELVAHCAQTVFGDLVSKVTVISSATPDAAEIIRNARGGASHAVQIVRHPASIHAHEDFYNSILHSMAFSVSRLPTSRKSVLLFYGNFFLQEELRRASESAGYTTSCFEYEKTHDLVGYESALGRAIETSRPDLIISVNAKGFDGSGIARDQARLKGIPIALWFVDDPHPIMLQQEQFIDSTMTAFCWERSYLDWLKERGFSHVAHLPLAVDPGLFSLRPQNPIKTELGFVGTSMGSEFLAGIRSKFLWREELGVFVDTAASLLLSDRRRNITEVLQESARLSEIALPFTDKRNLTWLSSYVIHTASMMLRRDIVCSLKPIGIETFGDPEGWQKLCGPGLKTNPDIDYTTSLATAYRQIGININITSCQMPSAVNQRVFDIPAAGSFVISDNQPDIDVLFGTNEIVTYGSADELRDKIGFYQRNSSERIAVSERARTRIIREHTYSIRLNQMFSVLGIA